MATTDSIKPERGDIVSFQLVSTDILGEGRIDVQVDSVLNYKTASRLDRDLNRKHANLYPLFKEAVNNVDDPSVYSYIAIIGRNEELEIVGIPWINASTYKTIDGRIATISIDNWRADWEAPYRRFMADLGANFTINVQDK